MKLVFANCRCFSYIWKLAIQIASTFVYIADMDSWFISYVYVRMQMFADWIRGFVIALKTEENV